MSLTICLWRNYLQSWLNWCLVIWRNIKAFLLNYCIVRHIPLMRTWLRNHFLEITKIITTWWRTLYWHLYASFRTARCNYLLYLRRWTIDHGYLFTASSCWEILFWRGWLTCFIWLTWYCLTCWNETRSCWISWVNIVIVGYCIDIFCVQYLLWTSTRNVLIWCRSYAKIVYISIDHQLNCRYLTALQILLRTYLLMHSFSKSLTFSFVLILLALIWTEHKVCLLGILRLWILSLSKYVLLRSFSLLQLLGLCVCPCIRGLFPPLIGLTSRLRELCQVKLHQVFNQAIHLLLIIF